MSEQDDGSVPEARRRRRWLLPVLGLAAVGAVLAGRAGPGRGRPARIGGGRAPADQLRPEQDLRQRPERTTRVHHPLADGRRGPRRPRRARRGGGHPDDAARADLAHVVGPVAAGGQALPRRQPRGGDLHLPPAGDRLSAALGQKMSYWTGTLPGPAAARGSRSRWPTTPRTTTTSIGVGFVADGTTAEPGPRLRHGRRALPVDRGACRQPPAPSSCAARPGRRPDTRWRCRTPGCPAASGR